MSNSVALIQIATLLTLGLAVVLILRDLRQTRQVFEVRLSEIRGTAQSTLDAEVAQHTAETIAREQLAVTTAVATADLLARAVAISVAAAMAAAVADATMPKPTDPK